LAKHPAECSNFWRNRAGDVFVSDPNALGLWRDLGRLMNGHRMTARRLTVVGSDGITS